MKKYWLICVALFTVFLTACGNSSDTTSKENETTESTEVQEENNASQSTEEQEESDTSASTEEEDENENESTDSTESEEQKQSITLYHAGADAQYVEPYVIDMVVTDDEEAFVRAIFAEVIGNLDLSLIDYRYEENGKMLVLNMGDGLTSLQGSAGEAMFVGSLLNSFFENFPKVETIKLEENGAVASLPHIDATEPFTREQAAEYTKSTESEEQKQSITLYREDADFQYVEAYVSDVVATDDESALVQDIFAEVVGSYNISLLDYRYEDNGKTLVLNMGDGLTNVQGSTGEFLFVGSLLNSFFENFPQVETIKLEANGQAASLAHIDVTEPFTREQAAGYVQN